MPYDPYDIFADDGASLPPRDVTAALFSNDTGGWTESDANDNVPAATIIDGGADTCVIGRGWRITDITMRTANVVGFDSRCFTPTPLPIGSACAIIETDAGPVMVRVHEAVLNRGGVSLLSKFQIRDYGFTVDDTGAMHGGKPRLQIDDGRFIRLEMQKGLAVCMTRPPNDSELSTMAPLDLTADDIWDPRKYDDGIGGIHRHILDNNGDGDDVHPDDDPLTVLNITVRPSCRTKHVHTHAAVTDVTALDPDLLTAKFLYRPRRVIETTLEHTTAYAKGEVRTPLQRHIRSRYPQLNVRRLREIVASDTLYGTVTALGGGVYMRATLRWYDLSSRRNLPTPFRIRRTGSTARLHPYHWSSCRDAYGQQQDATGGSMETDPTTNGHTNREYRTAPPMAKLCREDHWYLETTGERPP